MSIQTIISANSEYLLLETNSRKCGFWKVLEKSELSTKPTSISYLPTYDSAILRKENALIAPSVLFAIYNAENAAEYMTSLLNSIKQIINETLLVLMNLGISLCNNDQNVQDATASKRKVYKILKRFLQKCLPLGCERINPMKSSQCLETMERSQNFKNLPIFFEI